MDIRLYDFEFRLLAVVPDVISSSWSLRYNGVGTYEGHFKLNSPVADVIFNNRYIVLTEGDKQAVCTGKMIKDEIVFCGRTVNWLLEKRVIPPFKTSVIFGEYVSPEDILQYVLDKGFINPPQIDAQTGAYIEDSVDEAKRVDNFRICDPIGTPTLTRHFWRISANTVASLVQDLTDMMSVGHNLIFDAEEKCWRFSYIIGQERNLVVSEDRKNAHNTEYTEDLLGFATGGWYAQSTQTEDAQTYWNYICREAGLYGIYNWDTVLSGSGQTEAESDLEKKQNIVSVALDTAGLRFGTDYGLGDIVTIGIRKGEYQKNLRARVTGVNIWRMYSDSGEEPVLSILEEEE